MATSRNTAALMLGAMLALALPTSGAAQDLQRGEDLFGLCLQCHGDFPSFHDQTVGAVFTDCLRCHTEIHGSHFSRFFFR